VASILTNGQPVAFVHPTNVTLVWSNLMADGTIRADFAQNVVTNGVPEWWLAGYGLTNVDADSMCDADHDGMLSWQEWVAGTDPTNIGSVFRVVAPQTASSDGFVVRWPSVSNRSYNLYRAMNLMEGTNAFSILPGR